MVFDEIRHNEFHPVIVRKDKRPIEFSAIELTMYQDYEMEHMESISQMLEVSMQSAIFTTVSTRNPQTCEKSSQLR